MEQMGTEVDIRAQAVNMQTIILTLGIPMVSESVNTIGEFLDLWVDETNNVRTRCSRKSFVRWMRQVDPQKNYREYKKLGFIVKQTIGNENETRIISNLTAFIYRAYKFLKTDLKNEKSKKQYSSYLFNIEGKLDNFLLGMEKLLWRSFHRDHPQFTGEILTRFLDFLEQKALDSTSGRPYLALLICRALIYAPLPAQKLFSLGAPDEEQYTLECEGEKFHVTGQFIKFWKCFNEPHLFPNSLRNCKDPEKRLNTIIKRLSKRAKLPICLTPTMLRLVREACCPKGRVL
jgi:hypothetical protein